VCGRNRVKLRKPYALLREMPDWFTEGFETADLKEAGELLAKYS